jgi:hypothetical protein
VAAPTIQRGIDEVNNGHPGTLENPPRLRANDPTTP